MTLEPRTDTKRVILEQAIPLFAERGYNGVSMRDIAEAVGIRAPALYNHYRDKQTLYLAAISQIFASKGEALAQALSSEGGPRRQLEAFIHALCRLVSADQDFTRLMQREVLDGDETRLRYLAEEVFGNVFGAVCQRIGQIAPDMDAHLAAVSLMGMVCEHFEMAGLRRFLPGNQPAHEDPEVVARHVCGLWLSGILTV